MNVDSMSNAFPDALQIVPDCQCRKRGTQGIVVMRDRRSEHAHDAIPDVLVDGAAMD